MNKKFNQLLRMVNDLAAGLSFIVMFLVVFGAVILRYLFAFSFRWTEELSRYLFIYMVFLGIPIAFRERIHVTIDFFVSRLSRKTRHWLDIFYDILIGITVTYISYHTIIMIMGPLGKTLSPGLKIPMAYVYASIIVCNVLLLIEIIHRLFIKGYRETDLGIDKNKYV